MIRVDKDLDTLRNDARFISLLNQQDINNYNNSNNTILIERE